MISPPHLPIASAKPRPGVTTGLAGARPAGRYTGTGFPCRKSWTCGFRIQPATGDPEDLRESARLRSAHERACRFAALGDRRLTPRPVTIDERATLTAERDIDEEIAFEARFPDTAPRIFRCKCSVCGDRFDATGPRARFCPKGTCQMKRKTAAA